MPNNDLKKLLFYTSWFVWILLFVGSLSVFILAASYEVRSASFSSEVKDENDEADEALTPLEPITLISAVGKSGTSSVASTALPKVFSEKIQAGAILVADLDTGDVLVERNKNGKYPIASLTKLLTAIVAKENINDSDSVLITNSALGAEGNSGGLKRGERLLASELMYPLLIVSSNDASEAFAEHYGRKDFIRKMNEKAVSIGAWNSKFSDPSGLGVGDTSTAHDVFQIVKWMREYYPGLLAVTNDKTKIIKGHTWTNSMRFLNMSSFDSGKNGFTTEAARTATVNFTLKDSKGINRHINITVLHSVNRNKDILYLLEYLKQYYGLN